MASIPVPGGRVDFDAWRRDYDRLSYAEHVEFYRHVAEVYPEQQHYNEPAVREFLVGVSGKVLEIGGWKGELAAAVLPDHPNITAWLNIEIAPQAITQNVCTDPRYSVEVLDSFIWDSPMDLTPYRTLVASHVIEHMKRADVVKLLSRTRHVEHLYVDAPLPPKPSAWDKGESSHIIEVGWIGLANLFTSYGFRQVGEMDGKWGPARWFDRSPS
jgi:hypothetical protein